MVVRSALVRLRVLRGLLREYAIWRWAGGYVGRNGCPAALTGDVVDADGSSPGRRKVLRLTNLKAPTQRCAIVAALVPGNYR